MTEKKSKKDRIDYDQLAIPKVQKKGTGIDYSQLADPKPVGKKKKGKKDE